MIFMKKIQKNNKLVSSIIGKIDYLQRSPNDINFYDGYDLHTNICVVVPFEPYHLYVEVGEIDTHNMIHFNLRGISVKNDLDFSFASVGELTLHEKIIVNFNEILRVSMPIIQIYNPIACIEIINMLILDVFCKNVLNRYLHNRTFCMDKNFTSMMG